MKPLKQPIHADPSKRHRGRRASIGVLGFLLVGFGITMESRAQAGRITGRVVVEGTEAPVSGAQILLFQHGQTGSQYVETGDDGTYAGTLKAGEWIVGVRISEGESGGYTEYYDGSDGVFSLGEATRVTVTAGQVTGGINFSVPDSPPVMPKSYTVSGTVTDTEGTPLAGAFVVIGDYEGFFTSPDSIATDAQGRYTVRSEFYAQRYMAWVAKPGYRIQFYDNQPSVFTATPIFMSLGDSTVMGIDFALERQDNSGTGHRMLGVVSDEEDNPVDGALVVGFHAETDEVRYALSNRQGEYTMTGLNGGDYYVLFLAVGLAPEFYGDVPIWQEAEQVPVAGSTTGINARLGGMNRPQIGTRTAGQGGQIRLGGLVRLDDDSPVPHTLVTLRDAEDHIVAFDLADPQGYYEINDAVPGAFTVHANRVRFEVATQPVVLDDVEFFSQTVAYLTLAASTPTGIDTDDDISTAFHLDQNYPNPFNPETLIRFTLPQAEHVTLKIYDLLGRDVATLVDGPHAAGTSTVRFEAAGSLPSGVYYYRLTAGKLSQTGRMVLVR